MSHKILMGIAQYIEHQIDKCVKCKLLQNWQIFHHLFYISVTVIYFQQNIV